MPANPPRVLHILSRLSYYGAENVVHALADELHRRQYPVAVMTLYPSPQPERDAPPFPHYAIERRGRGDLGFFFRMLAGIRDFRPDIVHTHVHNGKYWGRLAAVLSAVKTIVHTEHNSDFRAHPLARLGNRLLHPRTARIIAFSDGHADALAAHEPIGRARIAVIPNGIAVIGAAPKLASLLPDPAAAPLVAHVGRLRTVKNQRLALEAFALFRRAYPNAALVSIGDGEDRAMLEALRAKLRLQSSVHFLGFRSDASALLASADILLVTSTNEAMPLAVLEAMVAGVPVASTPWRGAAAILNAGRFGTIARDFTPRSVADAITSTLRDPATPARTAASKAFAQEHYGIERCADQHVRLYASLAV